MRVLIAGAGVAGLTLAALFHRQGRAIVVIDKRPEDADPGYVLALWPQGTRVLTPSACTRLSSPRARRCCATR